MRDRIAYAALATSVYTNVAVAQTRLAAKAAGARIKDHKSEIACSAATAVVVGVVARVNGFQAGYEFAQSN